LLYELPEFEYFEPETLDETLNVLHELGPRGKILAGGTDLLGLMKDRISGPAMMMPSALVNIKRIKELRSLVHSENESILGSALTLSEIHSDPETITRFPVLVQAAKSVATNQIRNMGTLGGNLCQRPWCWYFRHPAFDCFKKGGKRCFAITGDNSTYFSIYNLGTCVMSHPSDTAPALIALNARAKIANSSGISEVKMSDFFLGPKNVKDNILSPEDILVSVAIPKQEERTSSIYIKHRTRNTWDFALASVAAAGLLDKDDSIYSIRIVLGGVAPRPVLLEEVQNMIIGKKYDENVRSEVLKIVAKKAKPLRMNKYKVRIIKALVGRALDSVLKPN
jgi:xanthine dehydrogenase YagS FAD-binding subunit